jgi:hypothetical protein
MSAHQASINGRVDPGGLIEDADRKLAGGAAGHPCDAK